MTDAAEFEAECRIQLVTAERDRLATDALAAMAGAGICTPVEGYVKAPHCLASNIGDLKRERDTARQSALHMSHRLAMDEAALRGMTEARDAARANAAQLRDALEAATQRRWRAVECRRSDGTKLDTFNVVRPSGETWKDSKGLERCSWEHYGDGGFTLELAEEHVEALNLVPATKAAKDGGGT
jgi:hypothetical protein